MKGMAVHPSTLLLFGFIGRLLSLQSWFYFSICNFMLDSIYICLQDECYLFVPHFSSKMQLKAWGAVTVCLWSSGEVQNKGDICSRIGAAPSTGTSKGQLVLSSLNEELENFSISMYNTWQEVLFGLFFNCWSGGSMPGQKSHSPRQSTH